MSQSPESDALAHWCPQCPEKQQPVFDKPWRVDLSCCGRHYVTEFFADWITADQFREGYCTGGGVDPHGYSGDGFSGHQRAGIVTDLRVVTRPGVTA